MKKKFKRNIKKHKQQGFNKLNLFQVPKFQFKRKCPLSGKNAPEIDYKNTKLLKKYISENGKILPSRITSVSQKKQRELSKSIKRARILALIQFMQVILLENIKKLGKIGDIVKVKRGYARNYLIRFEKALNASKENIKIVNEKKEQLSKKDIEYKKEYNYQ